MFFGKYVDVINASSTNPKTYLKIIKFCVIVFIKLNVSIKTVGL